LKEFPILDWIFGKSEVAGGSEAAGQGSEPSWPSEEEEDAEAGDSDEDSDGSLNLDDDASSSSERIFSFC
jgi:hypothetical protein